MSPGRMFLVSASTLMSGTILAQAITFGLSFVLTRLYSPAEFGHYSIFVGVAAVLAAMSTGALDRVVLLARSDREARRAASTMLALSVVAAAIISMLGSLLALTGVSSALPLTNIDLIALVPAFMLCYAGAQLFTYSSLRNHRPRTLATLKVGQSVTTGAIQTFASELKGSTGLILGNVTGWFVLMVAGVHWRLSLGHVRQDFTLRSMRTLIRRYWRFPRYVMPNEVLDNLSNQVPVFLIGTFVSLSTAGHYGLAIMILSAPAAVMGQAVGQAFLQYIGRDGRDPAALRLTMFRIWLGMTAVGIVPFGVVLGIGPTIFGSAFGTRWIEAGAVAQLLAPLLFLRLISSPTSSIYLKLNLQREQWWFCIGAATYRSAAYGLGALGASLETMIAVHVVSEMVAIILYNLVALWRLQVPPMRTADAT